MGPGAECGLTLIFKEEVQLLTPLNFKKRSAGAGAGADKPYGFVYWDVCRCG